MGRARQWNLLRDRGGERRVANMELFFDLVFVFAVTQLSQYLLQHRTVTGALKTGLLLTMVWLLWAYTTWVTNWLDPGRIPVRLLLLLALMLISLVMSAALPQAFRASGLLVGCAYAGMQIGRSAFAVAGLQGQPLQRNYQRILAWCVVSGALALAGGIASGNARGSCGSVPSPLTCSAARPASTRRAWAGPARRSGTSRAATSPSGARRSS